MGLVPERIDYLRRAALLLGNIADEKIEHIGESVARVMQPFAVVPEFEHLKAKKD
jgi:hypothetical protein